MLNTLKSLVSKSWKNNKPDLQPGKHHIDEEFLVRVHGTVEKLDDEFAAPTVSIPLIPALAFLFDRLGMDRDEALIVLRDALKQAMKKGEKEDAAITARMSDVTDVVKAVRKDLIGQLPPMRRAGKVITNDLQVELVPVAADERTRIAA
ncbi:MAG: hypothetical protein HUJ26_00370 [Planctomycetaceae bacterium]|nr:hypothetical protein [Planctomycetaceae bacterium]